LIERELYKLIDAYILKYNSLPSKDALLIDIDKSKLKDDQLKEAENYIDSVNIIENTSFEWLINSTEEFVKKKAIQHALHESIIIVNKLDEKSKLTEDAIPKILSDALSISFNTSIGHDYFKDAEKRYESYHNEEEKIPFDIDVLNKITDGGLSKGTLTIIMGGIHVGKSALMCALSASNLKNGKNVLYISLEMSEKQISQRIDANLINIYVNDVKKLERDVFLSSIKSIESNTVGRLKVIQYPTSQAGSSHFRLLLNELKLKDNFIPDIIYIDYLNICISSNYRQGKADLYTYVKSISEEIRGLAVEYNLPIVSATQFNREGFKSSDPGMDNVSESFGTTATGDIIWGIVRTEELDKIGKIKFIQLKNRESDLSDMKTFLVGIDIKKMKIFDAEQIDNDKNDVYKPIEKIENLFEGLF
jgi:replicative DNA helicase